MNAIQVLKTTRKNILSLASKYSDEQLNFIPEGFSNNLIWNMGHVLVTQQLLCYRLAGEECYSANSIIDAYRKGSRPESTADSSEINMVKQMLSEMVQNTEKDIAAGKFAQYKTYPTSYGITLESFDDAMLFNNVHEGMHLGFMLALQKHIQ